MYPSTDNISAWVLEIVDRLLTHVVVLKHRHRVHQTARQFKPRINLDERRIRLRTAFADSVVLDVTSSAHQPSGTAAEHLLSMRATDVVILPRDQVFRQGKTLATVPNQRLYDIVMHALKRVILVPGHIAPKGRRIHLLA